MCWLILCVNLTGVEEAQGAGGRLLMGVSVRVLLVGPSICISKSRSMRVDHPDCEGSSRMQGGGRENVLSLPELQHPSSHAPPQFPWLPGLWTQTEQSH